MIVEQYDNQNISSNPMTENPTFHHATEHNNDYLKQLQAETQSYIKQELKSETQSHMSMRNSSSSI